MSASNIGHGTPQKVDAGRDQSDVVLHNENLCVQEEARQLLCRWVADIVVNDD